MAFCLLFLLFFSPKKDADFLFWDVTCAGGRVGFGGRVSAHGESKEGGGERM